jgi:hypothetical protein
LAREGLNLALRRRIRELVDRQAPVEVWILGIYEPGTELTREILPLTVTRHHVRLALASRKGSPPQHLRRHTLLEDVEGLLFDNTNRLLAAAREQGWPPARWILRTDSDVRFPAGFLDAFIAIAEAADFSIAAPAMTRRSYWSWDLTRARALTLARRTTFVEIGPVAAMREEAIEELLPFPDNAGMGWGMDQYWGYVARERGWRIGVVDAAPIRHERAPGGTYSQQIAHAAGEAFAASHTLMPRDEVASVETFRSL